MPDMFIAKYTDFAKDLLNTCPELKADIDLALFISDADKVAQFKERVLPGCSPRRDHKKCPGAVLPGVVLTEELWASFSEKTKSAVQEHLTLLSFCVPIKPLYIRSSSAADPRRLVFGFCESGDAEFANASRMGI
jgi:hypothetical protein